MRIVSFDYVQFEETPREWKVDGLRFGSVNLLVGSNASGKTRVLNVISGLAKFLAGDRKVTIISGDYDIQFDYEGKLMEYALSIKDSKVIKEALSIDDKNYLNRGPGGVGQIFATKLDMFIDFQAPENELAAVARRDSIQHPFFQPLNDWGRFLHHYYFGTPLGKDVFVVIDKERAAELDPRDPNQVIGVYRKGERDFGDAFKDAIKRDMGEIGYLIDDIGVQAPISVIIKPSTVIALYVKETGLGDITDQADMSQGMFRALSIIVQLNYSEMAQRASCILIDDIGEGLDFERSCSLIKLLVKKAEDSSVQLIMSTNDRFVMNTVPLDAWTVLRRVGQTISVHNYHNSKKRFDEFKFTGMNNFDLFAYKFLEASENDK